jgi:hypothetical protein
VLTVPFAAVGVVAATGSTPGIVRVFSALALIIAVLLGCVAWGVWRSVQIDRAEARLDATIEAAVAAHGELGGGCGHGHDADEMHVTDDGCAHDGTGTECTHSCRTCVFASSQPAPTGSGAQRLAQ